MLRNLVFVDCVLQSVRLKSYSKLQRRAFGNQAPARFIAARNALPTVLNRQWLLERPDSQVKHLTVSALTEPRTLP